MMRQTRTKLVVALALLSQLNSTNALELGAPSLWLGFQQANYDYFNDNASSMKPEGYSLGASVSIYSDWLLTLSHSKSDSSERWRQRFSEDLVLESGADTDTESYGISASLLFDTDSFDVSISQSESNEQSVSRLPAIFERLASESITYSFSYQRSWNRSAWSPTWQLGLQYSDVDIESRQLIFIEPPIGTLLRLNQKRWNLYSDFTLSYWPETGRINWSPSLTLGWTWEVDESGSAEGVIARSGEVRRFNTLNNRVTEGFRIPDSGYFEVATLLMWTDKTSSTLGFSTTVDAPQNTVTWYADFSYQF